jgi:hypothetical protein
VTVGAVCYTRAMTPDPFPTPTRIEPRGEPPDHGDTSGRGLPYPLAEARAAARDRLNLWLAQHPGVHPGGHGQRARHE